MTCQFGNYKRKTDLDQSDSNFFCRSFQKKKRGMVEWYTYRTVCCFGTKTYQKPIYQIFTSDCNNSLPAKKN